MSRKIEIRRGCFDRDDDDTETNAYASPPCYMHEVDPAYFGLPASSQAPPSPKSQARSFIDRALVKMRALYQEIASQGR
jgi:hypothetical protein